MESKVEIIFDKGDQMGMTPRELIQNLPASEADWVGIRRVREVTTHMEFRNDFPEDNQQFIDQGWMIEVVVNGQSAYQAVQSDNQGDIYQAINNACLMAKSYAPFSLFPHQSRYRPNYQGRYQTKFQKGPNHIHFGEINNLLKQIGQKMKVHSSIVSRELSVTTIESQVDFASTTGADIEQMFFMLNKQIKSTASANSETQSRSSGMASNVHQVGLEDLEVEKLSFLAQQVAEQSVELLSATECPSKEMDLILAPDQLYLQIHESIGHPLEIDRILGDERNYAGWSFIRPSDFGKLQYGSQLLNVTFDPTVANEMASYAFDDVGDKATKEYIIKDGLLLRGLGGLESQGRSQLLGVANTRANSWNRPPIDRMANLNIEPGTSSFSDLIKDVERGVMMMTNRSWSIDDYRNKFQFGREYAKLIENGKLTKTLKNPNYRGITTPFWNKLKKVGDRSTFEVHGSLYCGKGEPNQIIRVGHACPPCLFEKIEVFGGA